jgi:hypothetical protein
VLDIKLAKQRSFQPMVDAAVHLSVSSGLRNITPSKYNPPKY